MKKYLIAAALLMFAAVAKVQAGVSVQISIGDGYGYRAEPRYQPVPAYCPPAPVYVPAPVYTPAPVYVAPRECYDSPPRWRYEGRHHYPVRPSWDRHETYRREGGRR